MARYIVKRLLSLIPVIIGITFLIYMIMSFSPGDPAAMMLGSGATPEAITQLQHELGLDQPVIIQYLRYMGNLLTGDMGRSYISGNSVAAEIASRFPNTLVLSLTAMAFALLVSIPIGVICATKPHSVLDAFSMFIALLGVSMPSFWLGLMMILLFSVTLGWLPSGGIAGVASIILPATTQGFESMAIIARTTRSSMLEVIRQDYIRTARAKGVPRRRIIRKHALKNALIPTITVAGLEMGTTLGGSVLVETVFSWPGLGRLVVDSIKNRDTPMVLGSIIIFAICFCLVNLLVDILYAYVDPRIKSQYRSTKNEHKGARVKKAA